jgi:hypothetical protein
MDRHGNARVGAAMSGKDMNYIIKGWMLHSPYEHAASTIDEAVEIAKDAVDYNEWCPGFVVDRDGHVILDEGALRAAMAKLITNRD